MTMPPTPTSMDVTPLQPTDQLPLTCTRLGTCCHGHLIYISAYELARLAVALKSTPKKIRDTQLDNGGMRIKFNGPIGVHGPDSHRKPACSFYDPTLGCRAHEHRPLACRLYPLGRQRFEGAIRYYHPGKSMPCLTLCPDVSALPNKTVGDYLIEQKVSDFEAAHDGYAALAYGMMNAAIGIMKQSDGSLTDLANYFKGIRALSGDDRAQALGEEWLDALTIPVVDPHLPAGIFVAQHGQALSQRLQEIFLNDPADDVLIRAAQTYVLLALHLSVAVGADADVMATLMVDSAT